MTAIARSSEKGFIRSKFSMFAAYLRLEAVDDLSYPMAFALSEAGVVASVVIYFFVGQLVGDSPTVGGDYFTFATVGICVATILQGALSGFGGALQRTQNRGQFETLLVEPVSWTSLPFAMNIWHVGLGLLNGLIILLVGAGLGVRLRLSGLLGFAALVVLGLIASFAIGILSASLTILAKRAAPVLALYGIASSLLGGALFSLDQLPGWLRPLSWAIPHTYVINASRGLLMHNPGTFVIPLRTAVTALTVFDVVVLTAGLWVFGRSLQYARKAGILGGY